VPSSKIGVLRLLTELSRPEASIDEVEQLVSQDMSMSYRVLRCINSSFYNLSRKVDSIRQAIIILGLDPLRQLCSLVRCRIRRPPPNLLVWRWRARACASSSASSSARRQRAVLHYRPVFDAQRADRVPIKQLVDDLPLAPAVVSALIAEEGELGQALHCVRAYERGRWREVNFCGLPQNVIRAAYVDAVFWAEETRALIKK